MDESQRLTAGFEDGPESHNGADAFTIRVAFSEAVSISADDLRDHALEVLGGTVTGVQQVDGRADLWEITIQPDSGGAVSILLPPPADCGDRGAVCTGDGRALLAGLAFQIPGPPLLSVADAQALEGPNATLDFVVTRGGVRSGTATVDYATANGTATAGSDYFPTSGTLTFQPGDGTKTVSVPVYDDTVPDSGETLTLTLSNASGAEIADGEATGTILNVEPNLPATGTPTNQRHAAGGRNTQGGHGGHRRPQRDDRRRTRLPVGVERRGRRHGHTGRDGLDLRPGRRRLGQDRQGAGVLHRRRGLRRVHHQRAGGAGGAAARRAGGGR